MPYGTFGSRDTERAHIMAEREKAQVHPQDDQFQRISRATAEAQQEADAAKLDETVEGGRYTVFGEVVNSEGEPVNKKKD